MATSVTLPAVNPASLTPPASLWSALNPSTSRLSTLNIPRSSSAAPTVTFAGNPINDKRVRISMLPGSPAIFYTDTTNLLLQPLSTTNGVLFPFQPKVDISFSANYQSQKVLQSNFVFYNYENSEMKSIDLSCDFPVRNVYEGQYVVAAITFLRALTMNFTGNDNKNGLAGAPPLVVRLLGMGFGGLDYVPVAVTNVTTSYPDNVDFVTIPIPGLNNELTKLPVMMSISVSCVPMFSRTFASQFSALDFSSGAIRLLGPNPPAETTTAIQNANGVFQSSQTVTVDGGPVSTIDTTSQSLDNTFIQQQSISLLNLNGN